MPDIEFIGFEEKDIDSNLSKIIPLLQELEFRDHIVFIRKKNINSSVIDLKGKSQPFVRIYTRSKDRARILIDLLKSFFDIEIIYIGEFYPKAT